MSWVWAALLLPVAAAGQTFTDATAAGGAANASLYCTGVAAGDYDGDGDVDLYVTNWGTGVSVPANALYENDGAGAFVDVASARGVANAGNSAAAAWSDFDNDGDLDLYVVDFYEQDFLYENDGGTFTEVGRTRGSVNVLRQGSETCVSWGDYDGDGWSDLYVGKYHYANELYHNRGDGVFDLVTDLGMGDQGDTQAVDWVDYDGDGQLDLYVVNREQANTLYHNASATFTEVGALAGVDNKEIGQDAAWGDYDGDGDVDLFVANVGGNALYRNDGENGFVEVGAASGVRQTGAGWITARAAWADYDGDGDLDLYLANGADRQYQPDVLLAGDGAGAFTDVTGATGLSTGGTAHTDVIWADLDNSGSPDLYITDGFGPWGRGSMQFLNSTTGSAFLKIQVQALGPAAAGSSRNAVGATVRLVDLGSGQLHGYRQLQRVAGASVFSFGVDAAVEYRVEAFFPGTGRVGSVQPGATVRGSESVTVVEPEP